MKSFTEYRNSAVTEADDQEEKDLQQQESDKPKEIKPTKEIIDELNENIEPLEDLIEEDFGYRFELFVEKYRDLINIYSENVLEEKDKEKEKEERIAKMMFKKLSFDSYAEEIISNETGSILKITPGVAFENFEKGTFYQNIGDENLAYYYNFETKEWTRNI